MSLLLAPTRCGCTSSWLLILNAPHPVLRPLFAKDNVGHFAASSAIVAPSHILA